MENNPKTYHIKFVKPLFLVFGSFKDVFINNLFFINYKKSHIYNYIITLSMKICLYRAIRIWGFYIISINGSLKEWQRREKT